MPPRCGGGPTGPMEGSTPTCPAPATSRSPSWRRSRSAAASHHFLVVHAPHALCHHIMILPFALVPFTLFAFYAVVHLMIHAHLRLLCSSNLMLLGLVCPILLKYLSCPCAYHAFVPLMLVCLPVILFCLYCLCASRALVSLILFMLS